MLNRKRFLQLSIFSGLGIKLGLFARPTTTITAKTVTYVDEAGDQHQIQAFEQKGTRFLSMNQLAAPFCIPTNGDRFLYVEEKKKLVIVRDKQRIVFSPNNTFVKINDDFYQMFIPTMLVEDEIFVAIEELIELMNAYGTARFNYDSASETLRVSSKGFNITGVTFDLKQNGFTIRVITTENFPLANVKASVKQVKNKLYLTILGGKINTALADQKNPSPIIKRVQGMQFEKSAQLVFTVDGQLRHKLINVKKDDSTFDLLIVAPMQLTKTQQDVVKKVKAEQDEKQKKQLQRQHDKFVIDTVVIDPGHGGRDPGALGWLNRKKRLMEKEVVLDIGQKIRTVIKNTNPNVKVVLTRSADEYVSLVKRGKIANNNKGKLFVSLHCNANRSRKANGFETYVLGTNKDSKATDIALAENKVVELYEDASNKKQFQGLNFIRASMLQKAYVKHSFYLAELIDEKVGVHMKSLKVKNRGVKQAGFWVLFGPSMPSILLEIAFISNPHEVKILARKSDRTQIAKSVAWAILEYKKDIDSMV